MVNTTPPPRQVSIRKTPLLLTLLTTFGLFGCQSAKETTVSPATPPPAVVGKTSVVRKPPLPSPNRKTGLPQAPIAVLQPVPIVVNNKTTAVQTITLPRNNATASSAPVRLLDLPNEVTDWRITRISTREWRVAPVRRYGLGDSLPSLMEDAIITSGLHARLQAVPELRATTWKYSSNAGTVLLNSPSLTCDQALAAIRAVVTLDKVGEVRLVTSLRP